MKKGLLICIFLLVPFMIIIGFFVTLRGDDLAVDFPYPGEFDSYEEYMNYNYIEPMLLDYDRPVHLDSIMYVFENSPKINFDFSLRSSFDTSVEESPSYPWLKPFVDLFSNVLGVFDFLIQCVTGVINALIFLFYWLSYLFTGEILSKPTPESPEWPGFGGGGGGGRH